MLGGKLASSTELPRAEEDIAEEWAKNITWWSQGYKMQLDDKACLKGLKGDSKQYGNRCKPEWQGDFMKEEITYVLN